MDGYGPATYGDGFADVYDDWYGDLTDVDATVAALADLARAGRVLELGVGTGRIALPLAAAGLDVTGLDASAAMLDRVRSKPGADGVELLQGDMAGPLGGGPYAVVFAAFNTFFNLTDAEAQARCARHVHDALAVDGHFVVEGFVPPEDGLTEGGVSLRSVTSDRAVITLSRHDGRAQVIRGQHVELSGSGVVRRPWMLHYRTPAQLDALVGDAGFVLADRWADWAGSPFAPGADTHISIYRRAVNRPRP